MSIAVRRKWDVAVAIIFGLLSACAHQAAAPVAQPSPPQPRSEEVVVRASEVEVQAVPADDNVGTTLASTVLYFDFDKDILKPESQDKLQRLADVLRKSAKVAIQIQGNCDERGTEEYNLHLGQRRASVASKYLVDLGVDAARVDTISFGFLHPVDPRHNEEAWAKNRRDDFVRTDRISSGEQSPEKVVGAVVSSTVVTEVVPAAANPPSGNDADVRLNVYQNIAEDENVMANFRVDRDLGRAWIEVAASPWVDPEQTDLIARKTIEGLYYDPARKAVIYQNGANEAICAEDWKFLFATSLKSTGHCDLQLSSGTRRLDNGFKVEKDPVTSVTFVAHDAASAHAAKTSARDDELVIILDEE